MGLYEVTLTSSLFNQEIINRWNYSAVDGAVPLPSEALADGFGALLHTGAYPADTIMADIAALTSNDLTFQQLTVLNLFDPMDFFQAPFVIPYVGAYAGTSAEPFKAWGFRTTISRRDISRAYKRFAGVPNAANSQGGLIGTTPWMDNLVTLAAAMTAAIDVTVGELPISFVPVVLGKERYNPDTGLADPAGRAYRYFSEADQPDHVATAIVWTPYDHVRSQVSRQYGHGR